MSDLKTKKSNLMEKEVTVEKSNPDARSKGEMTNALFVILGAVAAVVMVVFVYPYLTSLFGKQKEVFTSVEQLGQRHLELEAKVEQLQQKLSQTQSIPEELENKVAGLIDSQKKLEQEIIGGAVEGLKGADAQTFEDLSEMKKRMSELESKLANNRERMVKLPEIIHRFEKFSIALQSSKPYEAELQSVIDMFDPLDSKIQKVLQDLSLNSKTGVPIASELALQFKDVIDDIHENAIPKDWPWYSKLSEQAGNLFAVSKKDVTISTQTPLDDVFLKIVNLLNQNKIDECVLLAKRLPEFFGYQQKRRYNKDDQKLDSKVYSSWLDKLEKRQFIQQTIPVMEAHVLGFALMGQIQEKQQEGKS